MIQFTREIFIKNIIHFIILCLDDQKSLLESEWVHGSCQGKNYFMARSWWRVKTGSYCAINKISENFAYIGFVLGYPIQDSP